MGKALLTKEQANSLENALEMCGGDRANVSQYHGVEGLWDGSRKALNEIELETLNIALYVGYEVDPGPEDKILEYYHKNTQYAIVIKDVLNLLNIQIKDINC